MGHWKHFFQEYLLICTFFMVANTCEAQNGFTTAPGARSAGLGSITTTLDDLSGIFTNASVIAHSGKVGTTAYASQYFGLAKLREAGIAGSISPAGWGSFFASFRSTGFESYREIKFSLGYGRKIHPGFALSAKFNYHQVRIPEYGSVSAPSVDFGFFFKAAESLSIGGHLVNPVHISAHTRFRLPSILRSGMAYIPGKTVTVFAEIEKHAEHPVSVKTGIEYKPMPPFCIRLGARTEPASAHFGFGYRFQEKWSLDIGASYDTRLGITPGISLSFQPQNTDL